MNTNLLFKFLGNNVKQHFVNNLTKRLLKECLFEWPNSLFGRKRMDNPAWFNRHRRTGRSSSHAELRHVSHMPNNRAEGTSAALRHRRTGRSSSHAEFANFGMCKAVPPWACESHAKQPSWRDVSSTSACVVERKFYRYNIYPKGRDIFFNMFGISRWAFRQKVRQRLFLRICSSSVCCGISSRKRKW